MSRRTRIRHTNARFQLGRIHHNRYSQSQTHFPQSYSIFGSPIAMPTRFMPLIENNAINYVCKQQQLFNNQCGLFKLEPQQLKNAKSANITISGKKTTTCRQSIPRLIYITGMAFCCWISLVNPYGFRKKFFTRYSMVKKQYEELSQIISQLQNCQNLIINIQDNELTQQKMKLLTSAITCSMSKISDIEIQQKKKKHVTIRNYCYFMEDIATDNLLNQLSFYQHIKGLFVWQKIVVYSSATKTHKLSSQIMMTSQI